MNLSARNVSFGIKGLKILCDIDLEVQGGKTTVLLGPNGAGKSTLMKILSGYLKATGGEVLVAGCDPEKISLKARARMLGVLTQRSSLEFPFTAREVVAMGRMPFGVSEGFDEVTQELLGMFGVAADQSYLTMSGGEQQLVQLCRVFAQVWDRGSEAFLLLDEPMTALSAEGKNRMYDIIQKMKTEEKISFIIISHDIDRIYSFCDRFIMISPKY